MLGNIRQEIIWANHSLEHGRPNRWLSVPVVLTSHAWENGKNEQSHQDPALAEALLGEPCHVSRVVFPLDYNTAAAALRACFATHGQYWTFVVPKSEVPERFDGDAAEALVRDGAAVCDTGGHSPAGDERIILTAVGAFQLDAVLRAAARLVERGAQPRVVAMFEPGRFRAPRSEHEAAHCVTPELRDALYPAPMMKRVFVTHTRPEPVLGALGPLHTGAETVGLGFTNHGGTLSTEGMLFVNRCTWAHIVQAAARLLGLDRGEVLTTAEVEALEGQRSPHGVVIA
jgi:phosphoketolase